MMEDKIMDENENKFSFENPEYRHTYCTPAPMFWLRLSSASTPR